MRSITHYPYEELPHNGSIEGALALIYGQMKERAPLLPTRYARPLCRVSDESNYTQNSVCS